MVVEIGTLCVKTAGRDATQFCVVVEKISDNYVLIDGNTRRKKVNISHIEPLNQKISIKESSSTKEVLEAFEKEGIEIKKSTEKKEKKEKQPQEKKSAKGSAKSVDKKTAKKSSKKE